MHGTIFGLTADLDFQIDDLDNFIKCAKMPYNMEYAKPYNLIDTKREIKNWKEALTYVCEKYVVFKPNKITFKKGFKEHYFEKRLELLKELVEQLDMKQFLDKTLDYELDNMVNNKYGWQIVFDNGSMTTFDDFVRNLPSDQDKTYIIFATFDCHY